MKTDNEKELFDFLENTKQRLFEIEKCILALALASQEDEGVKQIFIIVYCIRTNALMLDLESVQKACGALEDVCQILIDTELPIDSEIKDWFLKSHDLLSYLIEHLEIFVNFSEKASRIMGEVNAHCDKLVGYLEKKNWQKQWLASQENSGREEKQSSTKTPDTNQVEAQLTIFQKAKKTANLIFQISKQFPPEEEALKEQILCSSRLVFINLVEAIKKSYSKKELFLKLKDVEIEIFKTKAWLELAVGCNYIDFQTARVMYKSYDEVLINLNKISSNFKS